MTPPGTTTTAAGGAKAWIGFAAMCLGMFMAILDIQIVASSLPDIQVGLHIPRYLLSWVQTSYLIAEVIAILLSASLTHALSTGRLFVIAVSGFTLASAGCAASPDFATLIVCRAIQGFCGGAIIPTVFTAGYLLFPERRQGHATLIAGLFAVSAPTLGPCLGGYITDTYDWPWLFLINLGPGVLVAAITFWLIRIDRPDHSRWRHIDRWAGLLLALALASLELLLKEGPQEGWADPRILALILLCLGTGFLGVRRCLGRREALVDFRLLSRRDFAAACAMNFVLGAGLYGSVYLLPMFLGYVRDHGALEIGIIMTTMGVAQLLSAPIAAFIDKHLPVIPIAAFGFALFGAGLIANGFETPRSDSHELFWPQILRGVAVLFCLLPLTRSAMAHQPTADLASASALLNLIRNLGGAIGIALVDTIINLRPEQIALAIENRLMAGDRATAAFVGLPLDRFHGVALGPIDPADRDFVEPLVKMAAATMAFNEAWLLLGAATLAALLLLPLLGYRPRVPVKH